MRPLPWLRTSPMVPIFTQQHIKTVRNLFQINRSNEVLEVNGYRQSFWPCGPELAGIISSIKINTKIPIKSSQSIVGTGLSSVWLYPKGYLFASCLSHSKNRQGRMFHSECSPLDDRLWHGLKLVSVFQLRRGCCSGTFYRADKPKGWQPRGTHGGSGRCPSRRHTPPVEQC